MLKNNDIFKINGYYLDKKQVKAVTTDKNSVLVIAGAGSGKTMTIVGKIRYLIETQSIKCEDILCISFTNDCVNNLKNSLYKYNYNIEVLTFHKLALKIIKDNNQNISVCDNNLLSFIINEFFYRNIKNKKLLLTNQYMQLVKLISTFINLFKSNNYDIDYFNQILSKIKYSNEYILI